MAIKRTKGPSFKRTSVPLGYMGNIADHVPDLIIEDRDPLVSDLYNYNLGTLWLTKGTEKFWMLVKKVGLCHYDGPDTRNAAWIQLNGAFYDLATDFIPDTGDTAHPIGGVLRVEGGDSFYTEGVNNIVTVCLADNITIVGTLTVDSITPGVVYVDDLGAFSGSRGNSGYTLIGDLTDPPLWGPITSIDASITVALDVHEIDLTIPAGAGTIYLDAVEGDIGVANPDAVTHKIKVFGGDNLSSIAGGNTITLHLDKAIGQPITNAAGDEGVFSIGGNDYLHAYGTANTFLGKLAGNRTLTVLDAEDNTGIGDSSLNALIESEGNVALGKSSSALLGAGLGRNTTLGAFSFYQSILGAENITIGYAAGGNLTADEDSDIYIGSQGIALETNTIRVGIHGSGLGQQEACYIAGIYDKNIDLVNHLVAIDDTGKLGIEGFAGNGKMYVAATGGLPLWANFDSSDGSVIIVNTPNSIDLTFVPGPGGGLDQLATNNGTASPDGAGQIIMAGGDNLGTVAAGDAVTINLDKSILQPITNAVGDEGLYSIGGNSFLHNFGTFSNTFLGSSAGNLTNTSNSLTGVGSTSLNANTIGSFVTALGSYSGQLLTERHFNSLLGANTLYNSITSEKSVAIGVDALKFIDDSATPGHVGPINTVVGAYAAYDIRGYYNTVIGYRAFYRSKDNAAHLSSNNLIIGSNAAAYLPAGEYFRYSTVIGRNSGSAITTDMNTTLLIGHVGSNNNYRLRIGSSQTLCYIDGIYGVNIPVGHLVTCNTEDDVGNLDMHRLPGLPWTVHSDSVDGQLHVGDNATGIRKGSLESSTNSVEVIKGTNSIDIKRFSVNRQRDMHPFFAYQPFTANNVTGDGTKYYLGTQVAFIESFDYGNNFTGGGGGARATFTAPVTGDYFLCVSIFVHDEAPPPPPPPPAYQGCGDPLCIETTSRTFALQDPLLSYMYNNDSFWQTLQLQTIATMTAGHTAQFSFTTIFPGGYYPPGSREIDIAGSAMQRMGTYICGHLI